MKRKHLSYVALLVLVSLAMGLAGCGPAQESTELNVLCTPQEEWCTSSRPACRLAGWCR